MPIASLPGPTTGSYTLALSTERASLGALTRGEWLEYDQLPHDQRRRDWLAGRCAAKRAVAERCATPIERIQIESREAASPRCMVLDDVDRWTLAPLAMSIAHRDGVGVAAVADCGALIGVDVERAGDIVPEDHRYFLAPRERAFVARFGATLLWVLKEAVWKALGLALSTSFASVQLDFDEESDELHGVWAESARFAARARVVSIPRRKDLVAAVVEIEREAL
jgi:phosphopantetheinyl transferase